MSPFRPRTPNPNTRTQLLKASQREQVGLLRRPWNLSPPWRLVKPPKILHGLQQLSVGQAWCVRDPPTPVIRLHWGNRCQWISQQTPPLALHRTLPLPHSWTPVCSRPVAAALPAVAKGHESCCRNTIGRTWSRTNR